MQIENYRLIKTDGSQYLFEANGEIFLSGAIRAEKKAPFVMDGFIAPVPVDVAEGIKKQLSEEANASDTKRGELLMQRFFEAGYIVKDIYSSNACEHVCVLEGEGKPVVYPYCNWGVERNPRSPEEVIRGAVHLLYR